LIFNAKLDTLFVFVLLVSLVGCPPNPRWGPEQLKRERREEGKIGSSALLGLPDFLSKDRGVSDLFSASKGCNDSELLRGFQNSVLFCT
jgi:hypothetical protein